MGKLEGDSVQEGRPHDLPTWVGLVWPGWVLAAFGYQVGPGV